MAVSQSPRPLRALGFELMPRTAGVSTGAVDPRRRGKQVQHVRVLPTGSTGSTGNVRRLNTHWTCDFMGIY